MDKNLNGEFNLSSPENADQPPVGDATQAYPKDKMHFYTSLAFFPEGISLAEQRIGEKIELFLRRHFISNVPWILLSVFLILLPITFPFVFLSLPIAYPSPAIITLILATYYLFIFGFVLLNFTLWYFHTGIVTNFRVVDIDVTGILIRIMSEAKNEDIQDVTNSQIGFIRSLFNYGDVHIQTSGSMQNIEFDRIPKPTSTARAIADLTHHRKI